MSDLPEPEARRKHSRKLHSSAIHLLRQLRKEDDATGCRRHACRTFGCVFGGPLTLGQLAAAEQVKPPTMTRIVTGLQKEGLVQRLGDVNDRRLTQIQATAKGRSVLAEGRARRVEKLATAVRRLGATELAELARGTQLLQEIIGSMRSPAESDPRRERISAVERRHRRTT